MNPPHDFSQSAQLDSPTGYPYSISARDLMQNFVAATVIVNEGTPNGSENLLKSAGTVGLGGHATRELYVVSPIPPPPAGGGIYVLGTKFGRIEWLPTEKC
jgi:hypothetical protein